MTTLYTPPRSKEEVLELCKEGTIVAIKVNGIWFTGKVDMYYHPTKSYNGEWSIGVQRLEPGHYLHELIQVYFYYDFTDIIILEQP